LLTDRIHVAIGPDRVTGVRLSHGIKRRVIARKTLSIDSSEARDSEFQAPLDKLLPGLLRELGGNADVAVVLANHYARYVLVPPSANINTREEEAAYVRYCFSDLYGADALNSELRYGEGIGVKPQVASAIETYVLEKLERSVKECKLELRSVQPYLMTAFNRFAGRSTGNPFWFVLVEAGRACFAILRDGDWVKLRTIRFSGDWAEELPGLIDREFLLTGSNKERGEILLCVPGLLNPAVINHYGWPMRVEKITMDEVLLPALAVPRLDQVGVL
jgi:hypothetical protein